MISLVIFQRKWECSVKTGNSRAVKTHIVSHFSLELAVISLYILSLLKFIVNLSRVVLNTENFIVYI